MLNRRCGHPFLLILFLLSLICFQRAWGEPVTIIRNNGDPENRVDFVVLGDGYTASELTKYANDVESFIKAFFSQEPFKEYQNYFNVYRVDVISNESGADHPPGVYKDTAFDATYNCSGIERLLCVNTSKVNTVLSRSLAPDQRDMVLVIVNDSEYGGAGGAIAVSSTHSSAVEIILHEEGHGFGLLADEYSSSPPTCDNTIEPSEPNVTKQTSRGLIKWNVGGGPPIGWIDPTTPIPTVTNNPGVPGLYQGARYCTTGLYRPTYNSKMRNLGVPFEQINEEQLVRRIYNWVSPLDSYTPIDENLTLPRGQSQIFEVTVPRPLTHLLEATWYVDNKEMGTGFQFTLDTTDLDQNPHTVEVSVDDPTSKVRNDPASVLIEHQTWVVQVTGAYLQPYQPTGWSDKIVVSNVMRTNIDSIPLYNTDILYVDWAVINNGTSSASGYSVGLYVDGVLRNTWSSCPLLKPNASWSIKDYSIGSLSIGTHTIKVAVGNKEYTKTINILNISTIIDLTTPSDNTSFGGCSLYSPPTFSWVIGDTFKSYKIQFSSAQDFSVIKVTVGTSSNSTAMNSNTWKRVVSIPGGTVYWRVVGTRMNGSIATSKVCSIGVEPAQTVGNPTISPKSKASLPELSWQNNCNTKFKVWFGSDNYFTKKTTLAFNIKNPNDNGGLFMRTLTSGQWTAIRKLVGNVSGSPIHWYVESWDGLRRYSKTDPISFVLTD